MIWLPVGVIEELDRFKSEPSTRGANAREVHRALSRRFQSREEMARGVRLENGGVLKVAIGAALATGGGGEGNGARSPRMEALRALFPDSSPADNRILAAAAHIADTEKPPVIVVTKDLNMQLKARAIGLEAQDYRTDRVEDLDIRRTQREAAEEQYPAVDVPGRALQGFASTGRLAAPAGAGLPRNAYALLRNAEEPGHAIPARHEGGGSFVRLREDTIRIRDGRAVKAANLGQRFLLDALFDPEISLVTVYGKAGTGKTLLSVGAALQQVREGLYEKLIITRVIMPTGRDIGYLPGRIEEKMQPWVQPVYDALEFLLSRPKKPEEFAKRRRSERKAERQAAAANGGNGARVLRPWEPLLAGGVIEIEAITHIRGRSIPDSILIVDEAQQLTPHEAKTIVTRMGRGSKLVLIGDLAQIDNPYVDAHTNGLVYTRNRLQGEPFLAHVNLFKGERGEMADIAANLM